MVIIIIITGTRMILIAATPFISKIKTIKHRAARATEPIILGVPKRLVDISPQEESITIRPQHISKNTKIKKNFSRSFEKEKIWLI